MKEGGARKKEVSREELIGVIADFLEMGHVDNIIAMFKQDQSVYPLSADVIKDERFMVRMGMAVLFEELVCSESAEVLDLAIPGLEGLHDHETSYVRGEGANLLAILNTPAAFAALGKFKNDPDPQVQEIVSDALASMAEIDRH